MGGIAGRLARPFRSHKSPAGGRTGKLWPVKAHHDTLTAALADRYRIERELGAGGMATVYLAHDLKHEREVAIKVLRPEIGAALGADRFLTEIKTTAKLQRHPEPERERRRVDRPGLQPRHPAASRGALMSAAQRIGRAVAAGAALVLGATMAQAQDSTGRVPPSRPAADGVRWQSTDGRWQAQLLGRLQFDFRSFHPRAVVPDVFSLRRIRFGTSVTYAGDYTFVLEGEYATGNAGTTTQTASLVSGYLAFDWFRPAARLLAGQFKPAFGLENTGSDNLTDFTERSLQFGLLQNLSYDRGVAVTGAPAAFPGLSYSLAATNGTGINTEEQAGNAQSVAADGKMVTLRLTQNVAAWLGDPHSVYHLGLNYKRGDAANSPAAPYTAPALQTEGRGVTFFTPQPFNAAGGVTATNVGRRLAAYELSLARGPVKLQSEYWTARYSGTRQEPAPIAAYDLHLSAYYVDLLWMITGEEFASWYQGGLYGRIRPRRELRQHQPGWGALQVGLRYSAFDGDEFGLAAPANAGRLAPSAPTTQPTSRAHAWTAGVTWVPNPFVRVMVNYVHTRFETPVVVTGVTMAREHTLVARAQIDF